MFAPSAPVDAVFALFGVAAVYYTAEGATTPCSIIVNAADDVAAVGGQSLVWRQRKVEVRVSQIARLVKDDWFVVGSQRWVITAAPRRDDPDQLIWACLCDPR